MVVPEKNELKHSDYVKVILMGWLLKLLGIEKKEKSTSALQRSGDDTCPKCGDADFSYDSYWKESCCQQCGWIFEGKKVDWAPQKQSDTQPKVPNKIQRKGT